MYWQNSESSLEGSNKATTKIYRTVRTRWGWNCRNSARGFKITFKTDSSRAQMEKYFSHKLHVVKTKSWYIKIMWNKQWLTTMLTLLQQASLLRGLGSLNQRSEWLWLPHHFSVYTTLAALNIFWPPRTAWAVLPPASGVQAFCSLQLTAVLVTVAQWWDEQLLRRKWETGECQGSYLSFHKTFF